MKLRAWLDAQSISNGEFAGTIGRTAEAVRRYAAGERLPDRETMPLIIQHTGGAVQPNDFFDLGDALEPPPPFREPSRHAAQPAQSSTRSRGKTLTCSTNSGVSQTRSAKPSTAADAMLGEAA